MPQKGKKLQKIAKKNMLYYKVVYICLDLKIKEARRNSEII